MTAYMKCIIAGLVAACTTGASLAADGWSMPGDLFGTLAAGLAALGAVYAVPNSQGGHP